MNDESPLIITAAVAGVVLGILLVIALVAQCMEAP
jgi:hypothetical protein